MPKLTTIELSQRAIQHAISVTNAPCEFVLGTDINPYMGGECAIFVFKVNGKGMISIRLEHTPSAYTSDKVTMEAQHLTSIAGAGISRLPKLLGYSSAPSSTFIALKWAEGTTLQWTDSSPPYPARENILQEVAQTILDLLQIRVDGIFSKVKNWK